MGITDDDDDDNDNDNDDVDDDELDNANAQTSSIMPGKASNSFLFCSESILNKLPYRIQGHRDAPPHAIFTFIGSHISPGLFSIICSTFKP